MSKNVLVIAFSQTGQLTSAVERVVGPLREAGHRVHCEMLQPETPFPWPWPLTDFVDAFAECVQLDPPPLKPLSIPEGVEWDLVILGYAVWYLSPALPVTAFLQSPAARQHLAGRPVVTLVACRNMWLTAQATVTRLIGAAGGVLRDHIALTDQGPPLATFITTPRWVLTGRRDTFCGLPPAGVAACEIHRARRFGLALAVALARDGERCGEPMLHGLAAVTVIPRLAMSERAAYRAFRLWSRLIRSIGRRGQWRRRPILIVFALYLIIMVMTVVPLSLLVQWLLSPLLEARLARLKAALEAPSGSATDRIDDYAI